MSQADAGTMPAGTGDMPVGVWLRRQREARGLARREMARRLIKAGKAAGDETMPSIESVSTNIRRWENGANGLTERYKLFYCEALEITAVEFGRQVPDAGHIATVNAHGLSVSLQYVSGRLVIDISGQGTPELQETLERQGIPDRQSGPERALALVTSPSPPKNYGGRA